MERFLTVKDRNGEVIWVGNLWSCLIDPNFLEEIKHVKSTRDAEFYEVELNQVGQDMYEID